MSHSLLLDFQQKLFEYKILDIMKNIDIIKTLEIFCWKECNTNDEL